jgi:hypothetical protein
LYSSQRSRPENIGRFSWCFRYAITSNAKNQIPIAIFVDFERDRSLGRF